tara:strand:+ start:749 stop:1705 length:957 start_codon:yes stop_codon:yes gene_type:complete
MKITFFSESQIRGKVPRDFENARTEFGWSAALDAEWCPIGQTPKDKCDLGIVIIPKNNPNVDITLLREFCDKIAVMQEGPHWYFQDYTIDKQFQYYNSLIDADWVYCHNESDVNYYLGLGCKDVRVMRSLMITDGLIPRSETLVDNYGDLPSPKSYKKPKTMMGGNFCNWYGGFDSYMVAREIGNPISAPSMGRKQEQEDMIEDINYLPYMNWREWINTLSEYNIGVHLMRTHAAGTFSMNCGFHGIPCIGYKGLDTQELLHPLTTVEVGDLDEAKRIGRKLQESEKFYNLCSETIRKRFNEYYTEKAWKTNWKATNK